MMILVFENIQGEAIDRLGEKYKVSRNTNDPGEAMAVIVRNKTSIDEKFLNNAPNLKVVGRAGVGLDNIDVNICTKRGIIVVNTPGANANSVAELVFSMLLSLARKIPEAQVSIREGKWERENMTGIELMGKTMGVIGFGRIGRHVCKLALSFSMNVIAHDPYLKEADVKLVSLEELLDEADIVSLHIPLTNGTRSFMNSEKFSMMKKGSILINTSRGEIVDENSLIEELRNGRLAGACLDVREMEPPVPGELEKLPGVILTPHIGSFTVESQARTLEIVTSDIASVLEGSSPKYPVG